MELFVEAESPDEAARVLLLKADAESDPNRRMVICAQAARVGDGSEHGEEAARRKAVLAYDLIRATKGAPLQGEVSRAAAELENVGEWERAAEAYALVGDTSAEIRVLKDAGAIEQLEERLRATSVEARRERDRAQLLQRIRDLDAIGERREALRNAREWLMAEHDEQIQLEIDRIEGRLIAGPVALIDLRGEPTRFAFGVEVTIGRARADIVISSSSISRQHLRLFRRDGAPHVEDLETRNGTMLAGARVRGPIAGGERPRARARGSGALLHHPHRRSRWGGHRHRRRTPHRPPRPAAGGRLGGGGRPRRRGALHRAAVAARRRASPHERLSPRPPDRALRRRRNLRTRGGAVILSVPDPGRPTVSLRRPK